MARNNAWANGRLLGACCALSVDEFAARQTGFFPSLKSTLNHILSVDRYYLDAMEEAGEGRAVYNTPEHAHPLELRDAQAEQDALLVAFCDGLTEKDLDRTVSTDRGEQGIWQERLDALLPHLFQHQIHHRGQAHAMLAGTRVAPPQLDDFFLVFGRATDIASGGGPDDENL